MSPVFLSFAERPWLVIWEVTRSCDLVCRHCRAEAQSRPLPGELSTREAETLLSALSEWKVPLLVLTGGDPLKRGDLAKLIQKASQLKLNVALAPSVTPLFSRERLRELKAAGLKRIAVSLDGPDAPSHDAFRGIAGTFQKTLQVMEWIQEEGLELQVNTSIGRFNAERLSEQVHLLRKFKVTLWSVFFLVPTGRADRSLLLNATETERVLHELYIVLEAGFFPVKTTEAPQFRRIILQKRDITPRQLLEKKGFSGDPALAHVARGINDARGFCFISSTGEMHPSGFLPLSAGNIRNISPQSLYRDSPLFQKLRDPDALKGKCGACEYRFFCGGSRAKAFAVTGDPLASDPFCTYQPDRSALQAVR